MGRSSRWSASGSVLTRCRPGCRGWATEGMDGGVSLSPRAGVDFFAQGGLPVPQVTILEAERVAASFGLTVRAQPLGSQQDSNFLLADGGSVLGVLEIANPAFSAAEIEAQDRAAAHIAAACPDLRGATV